MKVYPKMFSRRQRAFSCFWIKRKTSLRFFSQTDFCSLLESGSFMLVFTRLFTTRGVTFWKKTIFETCVSSNFGNCWCFWKKRRKCWIPSRKRELFDFSILQKFYSFSLLLLHQNFFGSQLRSHVSIPHHGWLLVLITWK